MQLQQQILAAGHRQKKGAQEEQQLRLRLQMEG
jgi:hypothetical protein